MFERVLEHGRRGIVRACADDIAFSLARLSHLELIFPIYEKAQNIAGLTLKIKKCNLTPGIEPTPRVKSRIHRWLESHIPNWTEFKVLDAVELLGFFLGTKASEYVWAKPIRKYKRRVADIKRAAAGIALNIFDYNVRVVPVLGYVAQLFPLPIGFQMDQRVALHTLYRAPMNTFAHSDFFQLNNLNFPKIRCALCTSAASLVRTATKTTQGWRDWLEPLRVASDQHLPVSRCVDPRNPSLSPLCWDSPSFVELLSSRLLTPCYSKRDLLLQLFANQSHTGQNGESVPTI